MIACLQTRKGEIHYINWLTARGYYHTMCGKSFHRKDRLNTYSIDNSITEACSNCRAAVISFADDDGRVRSIHGSLIDNSVTKYKGIQMELDTTKDIYSDVLKYRYWPKLRRMKSNRKSSIYEK